jgi:hypothetical protein
MGGDAGGMSLQIAGGRTRSRPGCISTHLSGIQLTPWQASRPRPAHIYHNTNALDGGANQVMVVVDSVPTEARG